MFLNSKKKPKNANINYLFSKFQDNYNVLHIAAMYSREDVVKLLINKRGVDPFTTGGVSILFMFNL